MEESVMKFEVLYNDYEDGYIVRLEDGTAALVNTKPRTKYVDDIDILMQFGQWLKVKEPVDDEILKIIEEVLA